MTKIWIVIKKGIIRNNKLWFLDLNFRKSDLIKEQRFEWFDSRFKVKYSFEGLSLIVIIIDGDGYERNWEKMRRIYSLEDFWNGKKI